MGMTITDSVKELQNWRDRFAYDWGDYSIGDSSTKHALDTAVDTMHKYEKVQEIVKNADTSSTIKSSLVFSEIRKVVEDASSQSK